jgi:hypothetical protein
MRFRTFLSTAFTLLTLAASAQKSSLLWEVSGKGLSKPSYVFGTFHLVCPKDFKLSDSLKGTLAATEQTYLEIDMDDPALFTSMQKLMLLDSGKTIQTLLPADDYQYLAGFFKDSLKMNLTQMQSMKPFILTSMLYPKMLGCQPTSPELIFVNESAKRKHEVLGLETAESQFAVLDKAGQEKAAEQLVKAVREYDKSKGEFQKLAAQYRTQDVEKLAASIEESPEYGELAEDLLWKRNAAWIPVMTKAMQAKPTFFAVGAGHLGGAKGVLALLKKQGYAVKPVPVTF